MAIVGEWLLSKEAVWQDFIVWTGLRIGTWSEHELIETATAGEPEFKPMAQAELDRRAKLEE
jgi:hypothetical protein